jgi:hypothetical protein
MMLTKAELDGLAAMPRDQLVKLLEMIREARALFSVQGCMPQSAMDDLARAVPDKLCQEIVADLRGFGRAQPGGFLGPTEPSGQVRRASGGETPLEPPPGVKWIDQMVDVQDALDKRDLEKRLRGG